MASTLSSRRVFRVQRQARRSASAEPATDDADFADATFEGAFRSFELQNHAAGDDAALDQALNFFAGDGGEDFFTVEHTGDVG